MSAKPIPCDHCGKPTKWTKRFKRDLRIVTCERGYLAPCRRAVVKRLIASGVLVRCRDLSDCEWARFPTDTTPCFRCNHERQRRADLMRDRRLRAERVADARRREDQRERKRLPPEYALPFFAETVDQMKAAVERFATHRLEASEELIDLSVAVLRCAAQLEEQKEAGTSVTLSISRRV